MVVEEVVADSTAALAVGPDIADAAAPGKLIGVKVWPTTPLKVATVGPL